MTYRLARWIPALTWMTFIFVMSSREQFPQPPGVSTYALSIVAHLVLYGVLALLVLLAFEPDKRASRSTQFAVVAIAAIYGVSDEFHQSFVPGRDASVLDLFVNTIGATVAVTGWTTRQRLMTVVRSR